MEKEKEEILSYEAPRVELIEAEVERGFIDSNSGHGGEDGNLKGF